MIRAVLLCVCMCLRETETTNLNAQRRRGWAVPFDDMAILVNQELGEVPLYPIPQKSSFTCFEEFVNRFCFWPIDTYLDIEEHKIHVIKLLSFNCRLCNRTKILT